MNAKNLSARERALRRNVPLSIAVKLLLGCFAFEIPILVGLWQSCGMTMSDITLLQALFSLIMAVTNVPTGQFADRMGRCVALVVGALLAAAGAGVYCLADGFGSFLVAELLLGLGFSFAGGADQALLQETLTELGRGDEFGSVWSKAKGFGYYVMGVASVLGGWMGSYDMRWPLVCTFVCMSAMLLVTCCFVEPERDVLSKREGVLKEMVALTGASFSKSSPLRWLMVYPALLIAFNQVAVWFYQPYLELSGVKPEYIGALFAVFQVVTALSSRKAAWITERLGERRAVVLPLIVLTMSWLLLGSVVFLGSFVFILLQQFARGFTDVVFSVAINSRIPDRSPVRATLLSIQAMSSQVAYALLLLPVGWCADYTGMLSTFLIVGVALCIGGTLTFRRMYRPLV